MSEEVSRRDFLKLLGLTGAAIGAGSLRSLEALAGSDEIADLMSLDSIPEIHGSHVTEVAYDATRRQTNFDELVYQGHLPASERKPVIVHFYHALDGAKGDDISKRSAIVVRSAAIKHKDLVQFIAYRKGVDPMKPELSDLHAEFGIKTLPSQVLYLVEGGKINQADILRGGPTTDRAISNFSENVDYWISMNTDPKHKEFRQYEFRNSFDWHKTRR